MASEIRFDIAIESKEVHKLLERLANATSPISSMSYLEDDVYPWMVEETVARFAYEGDHRSGAWEPLKDSTQRIREDLGYEADFPINIRTQDLFHYVTTSKQTSVAVGGAEMVMPGNAPDDSTHQKYLTAQMGKDMNPLIEGAITPPRPVMAWAEEADAERVLIGLAHHVVAVLTTGVSI